MFDLEMIRRSDTVTASRIIRGIFRDVCRGRRRRPCSTICRRMRCCSSTKATRRFRNWVACITATARARKPSSSSVSACRSALDNRPLTFEEFENRVHQVIYVSATPGPYELTKTSGAVIEQIIRPTGLVDPEVDMRPIRGQVDNLLNEIRLRAEKNERVLVTTLTKRMSEDLAEHYSEAGVKCAYLHSEVSTLDRVKILRDLRRGSYDVLIGVNLLREGLDLPEVSLVAILDADKEGFLRSAGSLIQTMGRAARNLNGRVILYADVMTDSMSRATGRNQLAAAPRSRLTMTPTILLPNPSSSRSI